MEDQCNQEYAAGRQINYSLAQITDMMYFI